jgi:hypothetical protein
MPQKSTIKEQVLKNCWWVFLGMKWIHLNSTIFTLAHWIC